ncbi:hypothetical protein LTR28_007189 [Elasticomyces elasticus]|nr:hypothetical protein LTR28_007189 [Elasticomyces elasticus]
MAAIYDTETINAYSKARILEGLRPTEDVYMTHFPLSEPYYYLPTASAVGYLNNGTGSLLGFQLPEQFMKWIANNPQALEQYPDIGKCSQGTAIGAPTVHIPVNQLTTSSVTTIQMVGAYTGESLGVCLAHRPFSFAGRFTVSVCPSSSRVNGSTSCNSKGYAFSRQSSCASSVEHPNQGSPATTVPGVSVAGASTSALAFTVGSQEYTFAAAESSGIVLGTHTLFPGSSAIVISSRTISLAPSNSVVFVNGATATLPSVQSISHATVPPIITLGSQSFTVLPATTSAIVIASQTLVPGGAPITVSGQTISLGSSSGEVVVNGHTSTLQSPTSANTPAVITVGSQVLSYTPVASTGYMIGSHTVYPFGPAVTIAGQTVSIAASGSGIVVNGQTSPLVAPTPIAPIVTLGSQVFTYTPTVARQLVVESQTLYPGGPAVTVSGETISLPASATNQIVINGHTSTLSSKSGTVTLSVGSHQLTLTPLTVPSAIVIASQTLYPGGTAIIVGGETLSLPATGGGIVVASSSATSTQGLGGYIWSGLGGNATAVGNTPAAYTGGSEALRARKVMWVGGAGLVSLAWLYMV